MAGDMYWKRVRRVKLGFNPRPRMAGDAWTAPSLSVGASFNPRPRMAGDPRLPYSSCGQSSFNPRPRMAGDTIGGDFSANSVVSIHARAWRATGTFGGAVTFYNVSIHARAWRATRRQGLGRADQQVSIHARAWRATCGARRNRNRRNSFNPRPRMAGDRLVRRQK